VHRVRIKFYEGLKIKYLA